MKITEADKQAVLAALANNRLITPYPMTYADVKQNTGFSSIKLNIIKAALVKDGRIVEDLNWDTKRLVLHFVLPDKRQQIIDLLRWRSSDRSFALAPDTRFFVEYCALPEQQVHQLLIALAAEGLISVRSMTVVPSERFLAEIPAAKPPYGDGAGPSVFAKLFPR